MAFGGLDTSFLVIDTLVRTAFLRSVVKTILISLDKMAMQMSCRSCSVSSGSLLGFQEQNACAMLDDAQLSVVRSGEKVLVARCFVSGPRKDHLGTFVSTPCCTLIHISQEGHT